MAIEQFVKDMNIISALADEPTQTATELKAKFDEGGNALKTYINNTLKPYLDGMEDQIPKTYGAVSTILEEDLVASRAVMSLSLIHISLYAFKSILRSKHGIRKFYSAVLERTYTARA